ncbi:MAG: thiol-disulfide oxidoreductase [Flavobacteriales bacterium]|nr:thiol-disulfide oxidoreductase [Flavobacteriales bacterium]|tara:strand:- start:10396 stop:10899 length:504 start_codon:yes stop_codon:yes gene_type:complete
MFQLLEQTNFPPKVKPLMVYDGKCGFCKYWIIKWKKISGDEIHYISYQRAAHKFKDIEEKHFKEAVRLIDSSGRIYNGPDAAFRTFYMKGKVPFLHLWYEKYKWFRKLTNFLYQWVADNRNFLFKISVRLFGKSARNPQPFWAYYLIGSIAILLTLICVYIANSATQ